ncbi:hypothetical protein HaLaN_12095 [Haematococcus lacustris]|uniref:Uncharacterized protein n=1 Tax=Haematococcus lacustris TaxID=44745 RepID=A0A699YZW6_HAELA|nr:hypothetical protein HaLaN_12095 [Haematococcus lacustris]
MLRQLKDFCEFYNQLLQLQPAATPSCSNGLCAQTSTTTTCSCLSLNTPTTRRCWPSCRSWAASTCGQQHHRSAFHAAGERFVKLYATAARARLGWSGEEAQLFIRMACGYSLNTDSPELQARNLDKDHKNDLKEEANKHRRLLGLNTD